MKANITNERSIDYIPALDLSRYDPKKVAVYSRVSREGEEKHLSIENQMTNLEQDISRHPGWVLVDHYVDEGVTGTKLNRPEFNRLMEDARAGKIDIILTKSVSRFGRNMAAVQETINELNRIGVTVIFENDDINTANPDSLFYLQYLAIQAEAEAKQTSEYQKWAINNRFKIGIPTYFRIYGYEMKDKKLVVKPDEAKIIKRIFSMYLSGMGGEKIAKALNKEGVPSPEGTRWRATTVRRILTYEKYTGNLILQRWFRSNYLTKQCKPNRGELPQYKVVDTHEAIIDAETFQKVQAEIETRAKLYHPKTSQSSYHSSEPTSKLFQNLVVCAHCNKYFSYKQTAGKWARRKLWICRDYMTFGKTACPNKAIPEDILITTTKTILLKKNLIREEEELTNELLKSYIKQIIAYPDQVLGYHLYDGEIIKEAWQFKSRSESWTPEMKEKARQKTLERNKEKERKGEGRLP